MGFCCLFVSSVAFVDFSNGIQLYFPGVSIGLSWAEEEMRNEVEEGITLLSIHHLSIKIDYFIGKESSHSSGSWLGTRKIHRAGRQARLSGAGADVTAVPSTVTSPVGRGKPFH